MNISPSGFALGSTEHFTLYVPDITSRGPQSYTHISSNTALPSILSANGAEKSATVALPVYGLLTDESVAMQLLLSSVSMMGGGWEQAFADHFTEKDLRSSIQRVLLSTQSSSVQYV
jgi:hypothetical protein